MQIKPVLLAVLLAVKGPYVRDTADTIGGNGKSASPWHRSGAPSSSRASRGGAHKARSELNEVSRDKSGLYLIPALPVEPQSNYSRH